MNKYRKNREMVRNILSSRKKAVDFIKNKIGLPIYKGRYIKVRVDDRTPSCYINDDGWFYDFGDGRYYGDIVSLLFDGYRAFESPREALEWVCKELGINERS